MDKANNFMPYIKLLRGVKLYTNYDFISDEKPLSEQELKSGEKMDIINGVELLSKLEKQNILD